MHRGHFGFKSYGCHSYSVDKLTFYGSFFYYLLNSFDRLLCRWSLYLLKVLFVKFYSDIPRLIFIISFIIQFWALNTVILLYLYWFLSWTITAYRGMIISILIEECWDGSFDFLRCRISSHLNILERIMGSHWLLFWEKWWFVLRTVSDILWANVIYSIFWISEVQTQLWLKRLAIIITTETSLENITVWYCVAGSVFTSLELDQQLFWNK